MFYLERVDIVTHPVNILGEDIIACESGSGCEHCSQPSRADCRALTSISPVRPEQGCYGRPGEASVLDIHCRTEG